MANEEEIAHKLEELDLTMGIIGMQFEDTPLLNFIGSGRKDAKAYFEEKRQREMESNLRTLVECRKIAAEIVSLGGPDLSDTLDEAEKIVREYGKAGV